MAKTKPTTPVHFETAIAELETIVAALERGDLSLEASLGHYEKGVGLLKTCREQLIAAEQKVAVLTKADANAPLASFDEESASADD